MWEEKLLVMHTLHVMRSEKNLSENMLKTIFGMKAKVAVWKDMEEVGIQLELWLQQLPNVLTKKSSKRLFLEIIKLLRTTKKLCCKATEYNSKGWEAHERFKIW